MSATALSSESGGASFMGAAPSFHPDQEGMFGLVALHDFELEAGESAANLGLDRSNISGLRIRPHDDGEDLRRLGSQSPNQFGRDGSRLGARRDHLAICDAQPLASP